MDLETTVVKVYSITYRGEHEDGDEGKIRALQEASKAFLLAFYKAHGLGLLGLHFSLLATLIEKKVFFV